MEKVLRSNLIFALRAILLLAVCLGIGGALLSPKLALGQNVYNGSGNNPNKQDLPDADVVHEIKGAVKVTIQADKLKGFIAPRAMGMASSLGDNHLMDGLMPQILQAGGLTTLRYPGGTYSDNYHWSTYKPTKWQGSDPPNNAYYASNNDFGHLVALMDHFGTGVFTVNYGSNLDGTAGGTPEEAAAWVAYAMGDAASTQAIGKDASGHDWQTVGYWASLRSSPPLATDDGMNFLRIGHSAPVLIKYWEVGNEVYQNGYYGGQGTEEDLHAAYPKDPKDNEKTRKNNRSLAPEAYGNALLQFSKAMKAVDKRIRVGASLDIPLAGDWDTSDWIQDPISKQWVQKGTQQAAGLGIAHKDFDAGVDWDKKVLAVAGKDIDFVSLHWSVADTTESSHWQSMDNAKTLMEPEDGLPKILAALVDLIQKNCGANAGNMQVLVTELGIKSYVKVPEPVVPALFAADAYLSLIEDGVANIDWSDMRGGFLDDDNKPGPVFFGLQLLRRTAAPQDNFVGASSSNPLLAVYAFVRHDGKIGITFINKDPKNNATVKVTVSGVNLTDAGTRFDFGKSNPATGYGVPEVPATGLGNSFTVTVPSYTITDIVIPLVPKAQ
jgi:hypothetical protein